MNTTQRIGASALLVLSLAAAGTPGASGMTVRGDPANTANPTPGGVYSRQDKSVVPSTSPSVTGARIATVSAPPPAMRLEAPGSGFDWGDAGIGAAGGLALSMVGVGGALAVSQHRTRRARHTSLTN
jgi:hypothetical protein